MPVLWINNCYQAIRFYKPNRQRSPMSQLNILDVTKDMFVGGVDFNLPGNGGANCAAYLSLKRRVFETLGYVLFNCVVFFWAKRKCKLPPHLPRFKQKDHFWKTILLVLLCLVFGIELGYKLSTKQLIYLLNPCHILTITQVKPNLTYTLFHGKTPCKWWVELEDTFILYQISSDS